MAFDGITWDDMGFMGLSGMIWDYLGVCLQMKDEAGPNAFFFMAK